VATIDVAGTGVEGPLRRIDEAEIADFEARRAVQPPSPPPPKRRNLKDPDVIEYI
jgi:hypothetical protein